MKDLLRYFSYYSNICNGGIVYDNYSEQQEKTSEKENKTEEIKDNTTLSE